MTGEDSLSSKAGTFRLKFNTIWFLIFLFTACCSQTSHNVSVLILFNTHCSQYFYEEAEKVLRQDIFSRPSELIHLKLLKSNVSQIINCSKSGGVLEALSFIERNFDNIDGTVFVDATREDLVFSSVLEDLNVLTVGLFQDEKLLQTQESVAVFSRTASPSVYHYVTSAWRIITKHRWHSICVIVSASFEGMIFAEQIKKFALKEKWNIRKIIWLMEDTNINETMEEINNAITNNNTEAIVMHSRSGNEERLFKLIQELGIDKYKTVWIITDITTQFVNELSNLPQGLLKISLRRPTCCHDYGIYDDALRDIMSLFQLSFEESLRELFRNSSVISCKKEINSQELRRRAKRKMVQTSVSERSMLFNTKQTENRNYTFMIWNLNEDLLGEKNWFPVGMGAPVGVAMETYKSPDGKSITPVFQHPRPVIRVAVNEYPPFVYKVNVAGEEGCVGRLLPCHGVQKMFCCFGASLDFLTFLMKDLNFETYVYFNPDGRFGVIDNATGHWNGIVGELIRHNAELSLEMGLTERRSRVISFAHPTLLLELGILINRTEIRKDLLKDSWLDPFSKSLWMTLLGTYFGLIIVIWWLDRKSPQGHHRKLQESKDLYGFTLLDSVSYVGGVAFGKDIGPERTPLSTSSRTVAYVFSCLALIIINTYCANLTAFLLVETDHFPITGVNDPKLISEPPLFRAAVIGGSSEEDYFKNHVKSSFRKMYEVNLRRHRVSSMEEGVELMRRGEIQGLIGDYLSLSKIANTDKNCSFKLMKEVAPNSGYGFALPKNSPWLHEVSQSVLKHEENGTIASIADRWFPKSVCKGLDYRSLETTDFVTLFWTVAAACVFSLIVLFGEIITFFALVKFGTNLGPLGRFLKRFLLNARSGEEDQTLKQQGGPAVVKACDITTRETGLDNSAYNDICELERKIASLR